MELKHISPPIGEQPMQLITVIICDSPEDAVEKGHLYPPEQFTAVKTTTAVVVRKGTENNHSTCDLIFEDAEGKNT